LQRGLDLQHRFFGFTTRFFAIPRAYEPVVDRHRRRAVASPG
jgi:hypothetical protein